MGVGAMRSGLDTNVALYLLGGRLLKPLPIGEFFLSVISEIEMLSYSALTPPEELKICQFLTQVAVVDVNETVKNATIILRKQYRLKLPDTIVCATALSMNAVLLSNDAQLGRVTEISVNALQLQ
jgi:predicted nucleic acid-binding protein